MGPSSLAPFSPATCTPFGVPRSVDFVGTPDPTMHSGHTAPCNSRIASFQCSFSSRASTNSTQAMEPTLAAFTGQSSRAPKSSPTCMSSGVPPCVVVDEGTKITRLVRSDTKPRHISPLATSEDGASPVEPAIASQEQGQAKAASATDDASRAILDIRYYFLIIWFFLVFALASYWTASPHRPRPLPRCVRGRRVGGPRRRKRARRTRVVSMLWSVAAAFATLLAGITSGVALPRRPGGSIGGGDLVPSKLTLDHDDKASATSASALASEATTPIAQRPILIWLRASGGQWMRVPLAPDSSPSEARAILASACGFAPWDAKILVRGRLLCKTSDLSWEHFQEMGDVQVSGRVIGGMAPATPATKQEEASSTSRRSIANLDQVELADVQRDRPGEFKQVAAEARDDGDAQNLLEEFAKPVNIGKSMTAWAKGKKGMVYSKTTGTWVPAFITSREGKPGSDEERIVVQYEVSGGTYEKKIRTDMFRFDERKTSKVEFADVQMHKQGESKQAVAEAREDGDVQNSLEKSAEVVKTGKSMTARAKPQKGVVFSKTAGTMVPAIITSREGKRGSDEERIVVQYEVEGVGTYVKKIKTGPTFFKPDERETSRASVKTPSDARTPDLQGVNSTRNLGKNEVSEKATSPSRRSGTNPAAALDEHAQRAGQAAPAPARHPPVLPPPPQQEAAQHESAERSGERRVLNAVQHDHADAIMKGAVPGANGSAADAPSCLPPPPGALPSPASSVAPATSSAYPLSDARSSRVVGAEVNPEAQASRSPTSRREQRGGSRRSSSEKQSEELPEQQVAELRRDLAAAHDRIAELETQLEKLQPRSSAGCCDSRMCENAQALSVFEETLALRRATFGDKHPDVAATLNNMANLLNVMGERARALSLYEEALAVYKEASGDKHPDVAQTLNNMANLLKNMGERARALSLYEEALVVFKEAVGDNHASVGITLYNTAALSYDAGRYAQAAELYEDAARVYAQAYREDHSDTEDARAWGAQARRQAEGGR